MQKTFPVSTTSIILTVVAFEDLARGWIDDGDLRQLSPRTLEERRDVTKKLLWFLRQREYATVGTAQIRAFLAYVARGHEQEGGRWGNEHCTRPVKPRTVHAYFRVLRALFRWAVEAEELAESPMGSLKPPIVRQDQVVPFTEEQANLLLAAARASVDPKRNEALLQAVQERDDLRDLPRIATLRQVWERHFLRSSPAGAEELHWRPDAELARAAGAIESPYDPEARHSTKHDLAWTGYKVHLTETCDPELPRLITDVQTTVATKQDVSCTAAIQQSLAARDLLPSRQLVDAGYVDAELLVSSQEQHGVELFGPTRLNPSWQLRKGGYDLTQFQIDWAERQATCPEGKTSTSWHESKTKTYEQPVVYVCFARPDCASCPSRSCCVRSEAGRPRTLILRSHAHHQALQEMRAQFRTEAGRKEYQLRAGIEGTLSQGVRRCGLRTTRYRGLSKTHLQHMATAAALNVLRVVNHLAEVPLAQTRVSRFARFAA